MLKASLRGCLLIFDPPYNRSRNCVDTITTSMPFDATRCPPDESNEELALLMLPSVICLTMRTSGLELDITRCHQTNRKPVLEHLMMRPIVRRTICTPRYELHMLPSGVCRTIRTTGLESPAVPSIVCSWSEHFGCSAFCVKPPNPIGHIRRFKIHLKCWRNLP